MPGLTKQTVAVYLRVDLIEEVKRRKLNMSQLVNDLLEQFLFGNSNHISEEMLKLSKLEKKIAELESHLTVIEEIKKELEELKAKLQEKQEQKEIEENLHLIRELREIVFDDIQQEGWERWVEKVERDIRRGLLQHSSPRAVIEARLSSWAAENKISLHEARKLFCKAFPELKHLFLVKEVV